MGKFHLKLCLALAFLSVVLCDNADSPNSDISDVNNQPPPHVRLPDDIYYIPEHGMFTRFHHIPGAVLVGVLSYTNRCFTPADQELPNNAFYPNEHIIQRFINGEDTTQWQAGEPALSRDYTSGQVVNPPHPIHPL